VSIKLLKCPFCGKEAKLFDWDQGDNTCFIEKFRVGCDDHQLDFVGTESECVTEWNQRTNI